MTGGGGSGAGGGGGGMVAPEDVPIRLAVAFAPNRARLTGFHHGMQGAGGGVGMFGCNPRYQRRMTDALFVVANHGVLLEYTLDPIPDTSKQCLKIALKSAQLSSLGFGKEIDKMNFN